MNAPSAGPPAYIVNEIEVSNPDLYMEYARQSLGTLLPYGGRFLVRGGNGEALSGLPPSKRVVILAFPDRASAIAWRESEAYQRILKIRDQASTSRVYVVDGLPPEA